MKCGSYPSFMNDRKFRIIGVIIISVILIAVIVVCSLVLKSTHDESNSVDDNSTNVPSTSTKVLIVQLDNSDVWALDLDNNNSTFIVRKWKNQIHSFDSYMRNIIYISSPDIGQSIEPSSGPYPKLSQPPNWLADKIAVDQVNKKIYVLDISAANINIFDVQSDHYNIVMSHFHGAKDISVDSEKRMIFILQSSMIVSVNIDGTSPSIIVDATAITSLTIDHEGKIYYSDLENIHSINYTGNEHQLVTKVSNEVISIAALENKVYWLYRSYETENSILYSCKTMNGRCTSVSETPFSGILMQIIAYKFNEIQISNPCKDRDHACDHMCIMNSQESTRCVCSIGWQLDTDLKTCKQANDFLLYVEENYVKTQLLDDIAESFNEALLPSELNTTFSTECNFDFNVHERTLFYSDGRNMYRTGLATDSQQMESNISSKMIFPAFDWMANNLYYVSYEMYMETIWIWYIKAHYMPSSTPYDIDKVIYSEYEYLNITSLVVHPNRGVLFYTTIWNSPTKEDTKIHLLHSDGILHSEYSKNLSVSTDKNVLAIDCEDDQLYWFGRHKDLIYFADLDGNNNNSIHIKYSNNSVSMSIYKNWLYLSTSTNIWRFDKMTGQNAIKILPKFQEESQRIFGAKVFSRVAQPINKNHPCAINNGDCQRYCFGIPSKTKTLEKVCGCSRNENLNPDGKTCYSL